MAYKASEKYGLGRKNRNTSKSLDITSKLNDPSENINLDSEDNTEYLKNNVPEKPIFVIFNPKSLDISAEQLNTKNLWTRKLTGLQIGSTFLKEYDVNAAVEKITTEELESPKPRPYNKQIICFTMVTGGTLVDILNASEIHSPDTIITVDVHAQDINLIKHEMSGLEVEPIFIIATSGSHIEKLEQQWSNLEEIIKEAERQLKVATRKLEALKFDFSKRPSSKVLLADLEEQQAEADTIAQHIGEFIKLRKYYVTFNIVLNEDEDLIAKRIRNLYRVWQGEVVKRESMGNEHGVVDKEEIRIKEERKRQDKLRILKEQQEQIKLSIEKRAMEAEEKKKKKEESIPRILGMRVW